MATNDNELAVSPAELASAGAAMTQEDAAIDALTEGESVPDALAETVEVESDFWGEGDVAPTDKGDTKAPAADAKDTAAPDSGQTIKYRANGKDVTISHEEAAKRLALVDGAKKAYDKAANLQRRLDEADKARAEDAKYRETWEKLERIGKDPKRLYETITGERFDDMLARELQKRDLYQNASEEERRVMDSEERIKALEAQSAADRAERDRRVKEAEEREFAADTRYTQTQLEREFFKYTFPEDKPNVANQLKRMLWRSTVADLKDYNKQGHEVTPDLIKKAFRDNAVALQSFYKSEVDKGVKQVTDKKKADASEKAQLASTRNYSNTNIKELASKDPMALFRAFQRGSK